MINYRPSTCSRNLLSGSLGLVSAGLTVWVLWLTPQNDAGFYLRWSKYAFPVFGVSDRRVVSPFCWRGKVKMIVLIS